MEIDFPESNLPRNILPYDGESIYFGAIFSTEKSEKYLQQFLLNIPWKNDEAIIYGKHIITDRKVAWFGDSHYDYTYSGRTLSLIHI